jgi:hypothetical protein
MHWIKVSGVLLLGDAPQKNRGIMRPFGNLSR